VARNQSLAASVRRAQRAYERADSQARAEAGAKVGKAREDYAAALTNANAQGMTLEQIGHALGGISRQRVSQILKGQW